MTKRRLTEQQKSRIDKNQQQLIEDFQNNKADPDIALATVISHQSRVATIVDNDNQTWQAVMRQNIGNITCGDQVLWQNTGDEQAALLAIMPRKTLLEKSTNAGKKKPVAANLDQILIVIAPQPEPSPELLDRYLMIAENSGIKPVIVVNKTDLLDDIDLYLEITGLEIYRSLGYAFFSTSAKTGNGLEALLAEVSNKSSILVGQSGVGKSSIIQSLVPDRDIQIGRLTDAMHGRHTTSMSVLYTMQHGGKIIDSPGVRDFGTWHLDSHEVEQGYIELRPYFGKCRFSDCQHTHEPECALKKAVEDGEISERRFNSFLNNLKASTEI